MHVFSYPVQLFTHLRAELANLLSMRLVLVGLIGIAAFLFVRGLFATVTWMTDPTRRRLGVIDPSTGTDAQSLVGWTSRVRTALQPMARYVMPTSDKELGSMQQRFVRAGYTSADAMPLFYALKIALAVAFFIAYVAAAHWLPRPGASRNMFFAAGAAFLGLMLPNFFLNRKVERRQRKLRNAFPDALDLLIVCVESGLGLTAALQRVAVELKVSGPELAAELERINAEMQAGMDREIALRSLATRTGLTDVRALVGLLVQTLRFGTSVADTLRVYAEEFRDKRLQAAEEKAATIGTKMIFPMVVCFFPSFFLVAIGPGIIRVLRVFGGHG
jgi:tight adherence protein C